MTGPETGERLLLITGATGKQGGAAVRALQASGEPWRLRALARDPGSVAARALAARGVEVVAGDLDDESSLHAATRGAYGVYSVQTPAGRGAEGEERQGKLLAGVAAAAGVEHFVYSSVGGAERGTGVPHFEAKWRIEEHIRALGLPATILRPAVFMENFGPFSFRTVMLSMMKTYLPESRALQFVAVSDVGEFAARAFNQPGRFIGQAIELAGAVVTRGEAAETLRGAGLRPAVALRLPRPVLGRLPDDFTLMFAWFAREDFRADIPALRLIHPSLLTLRQWAAS